MLNSSSCLTICLALWWAFFRDKPFNKKRVIWFHIAAHLPKLPKGQNDSRNYIPFKYIWTPPNADQENLQTWWILTYPTYLLARSLRTSTVTDVMLLLDVVFHKITQKHENPSLVNKTRWYLNMCALPQHKGTLASPCSSLHSCLRSCTRKWKYFFVRQGTVIIKLKASGFVNAELSLYWICDYFSITNWVCLSFDVLITGDSPFQTYQGLIKEKQPKATSFLS